MQGFRAALKRFGLPCGQTKLFINADIDKAIEALLDTHPLPTAVFCGNDGSALRLMDVAQKRGIRIPEDLSLVGFDDIEEAATVTPALTTVRQPYKRNRAQRRAADLRTASQAGRADSAHPPARRIHCKKQRAEPERISAGTAVFPHIWPFQPEANSPFIW